MSKPSLKLENLNAFKNCGALIPLPQPNIQPNTSNFAQISATTWNLPPKFILQTLGNNDSLKDIHYNLYFSLI